MLYVRQPKPRLLGQDSFVARCQRSIALRYSLLATWESA